MTKSRAIHVLTAAAVLIAAFASQRWLPEVWETKVLAFGTAGAFLTLYGVLFAIIETARARSASQDAKKAAIDAQQQTTKLFDVKNLAECKAAIRQVLGDLDKNGWVSTTALARIGELYAEQFFEAYQDEMSGHRISIVALESHAQNAPGPFSGAGLKRLKAILLRMQSEIASVVGSKVQEKKT